MKIGAILAGAFLTGDKYFDFPICQLGHIKNSTRYLFVPEIICPKDIILHKIKLLFDLRIHSRGYTCETTHLPEKEKESVKYRYITKRI